MRTREKKGSSECLSSSGQVSNPTPSLQLSSVSDESLALLFLSHSDEVELMATFTPTDVISAPCLGSERVGAAGIPAGSPRKDTAHNTCRNDFHEIKNLIILYLKFPVKLSGHPFVGECFTEQQNLEKYTFLTNTVLKLKC